MFTGGTISGEHGIGIILSTVTICAFFCPVIPNAVRNLLKIPHCVRNDRSSDYADGQYTKSPCMPKEIGSVEISLMKKIKSVSDPKGILNPGKIF